MRSRRLFLLFALLAIVSGAMLAGDRELSHLALWKVTESGSREWFAAIETSPAAPSIALARYAAELPSAARAGGDLDRARIVARHVISLCAHPTGPATVRWAPIESMVARFVPERSRTAGRAASCSRPTHGASD